MAPQEIFREIAEEVAQFNAVKLGRSNPKLVVAGGSGFVGRALTKHFSAKGYEVVVLTRQPARQGEFARFVTWDGGALGAWAEELEGATALINLAGRAVNTRHTPAVRREIIQSRISTVRVLDEALQRLIAPPTVWVQMASLAIYGDAGDCICTEDSRHGDNFCVEICHAWEGAASQVHAPVRMPILRTGFVLGKDGGMLRMMGNLARAYVGGPSGSGRQYFSWVQMEDVCRAIEWCLINEDAEGVYNLTSPNPVTNAEFSAALRKALGRPWSPHIPAPLVRLAAPLLGTEAHFALNSRRGIPQRLTEEGFVFKHPCIEEAIGVSLA